MATRGWKASIGMLAGLLLAASGCVKGVVGTEVGAAGTGRKILVAVYPTEYKQKIAQGLLERFRDRATVTQVSVQDLKTVDPKRYDALVIIDQLMAWQMFNFDSSAFLQQNDAPDVRSRIVLFLTAGSPKPDYRFHGIDAMTGATVMNREGEAIEAISRRVEPLVGGE